ncbi:MAG: DHH family phosphoesterase [Kiritimatiellia bacterium]|jgi:phosphoesterase RecJ-like protein
MTFKHSENDMSRSITAKEMAEALRRHGGRLIVTGHVRPDGDALGSALGLVLGLCAAGLDALCVGVEPIGAEYAFLEGVDGIVPAADYAPLADDRLVAVDCAVFSRIPEAMRDHAKARMGFCIDHHKSNDGFAPLCLIDPDASSTAELVLGVLEAGGFPVTRGVAEALWVGIVTDTGRFSYSCTSPATLCAAARLIEAGARFDEINDRVFGQTDFKRLRLQRRLLDSLQVFADGRVSLAKLGADDYAAEDCVDADSDNFVDVVRSVRGAVLSAFLRQVKPGAPIHISLRTKPPFDASEIAAAWGGGGHDRAAGATVEGTLDEVFETVRRELEARVST